MKSRSYRLIVGIYSDDTGKAEEAYRQCRAAKHGRVAWFRADGTSEGDVEEGRRILRLSGEAIVTVHAELSDVQAVVQTLQTVGGPVIFVLSPKFEKPPIPPPQRRQPLLARLAASEAGLEAARVDLLEAVQLEHALSPSAEWLLDNAHLARTQIAEIRRHAPRRAGLSDGVRYARISEVAEQIVAQGDHAVQPAGITDALQEAQRSHSFSISELWAFPLLLELVLLEALARFATQVNQNQQIREAAYFWANRLIESTRRGAEILDSTLARMEENQVASEPYFITCLAEQLQDEESALGRIQQWVEQSRGPSLDEIVRIEHNREAAESVSISNAFGSLRTLSRLDFSEIFEATSVVEAELRNDPGGIYTQSDFVTRDRCRKEVERIARDSGLDETEIARRAIALAARDAGANHGHVAWYLLADGIVELERGANTRIPFRRRFTRAVRSHATFFHLAGILFLTASFLLLSLAAAWEMDVRSIAMLVALGALALLPLSELAIQILNTLIISLFPADSLPKMNFEKGIPASDAALVVIPMMFSGRDTVDKELQKLEVRYLANPEPNLYFALLADFMDAPSATMAGDAKLLQLAKDGIARLNQRYTGRRFLLFHRPRVWSVSEQMWIGKERKRGKLEELNAYLNGSDSTDIIVEGSMDNPVRYVITLDADTQLPPVAGRRMVETIAHPLNRVELDPITKIRKRGYTIIQPRVSIALPSATATRFTRIFADTTGTDPYCQTVSDAQQDLFSHAIFHGKAIYDVKAFHTILHQRFPPETLLSHDLIEGAHAGVGLATDIELFETMPLDYGSFSRRQHRWIRGDWQIAAWVRSYVPGGDRSRVPNPLTVIERWRILDNLRRSLVPVASVLLLLLGWLISAAPGVWSLVLALAVAIPVLAPLLDRLARRLQGTIRGWQGAADEVIRAAVWLAFMPHQAWLAVDAIARVTFRCWVSRRHLLEWQTAEHAARDARQHLNQTMRQLLVVSGLSTLLLILLYLRGALLPTAPFVALWIASPGIMKWLSSPDTHLFDQKLGRENSLFLRRVARRTWRYFDDLVNAESNWLPPDNSQLALNVEVAQRTSPTNMGLWLASLMAARDLGFVTIDDLLQRGLDTMATFRRLERYEGHFLNWYNTRTLEPILPRYVSTVDSGNLLASLWVVKQGCDDILRTPIAGSPCLRGLVDTLAILHTVCGEDPSADVPIQTLRRILRGKPEGHVLIGRLRLARAPAQQLRDLRWVLTPGDERSYWAARLVAQVESWNATVDRYLTWMELLTHPPDSFLRMLGDEVVTLRRRAVHAVPSLLSLAEGYSSSVEAILSRRGRPELRPEVATWLEQLAAAYEQSRANAVDTVRQVRELGSVAGGLADSMNMRFLYDEPRRLFGVGYAVGDPLVFTSHYDLLASECRVASLVAIAKGDVPLNHWHSLGRPRVTAGKRHTLLSWSGTMFEYLMPLLFTRTFTNSLLDQACRDALERQIDYGKEHGIPWGVSECAYSALDAHQIYQYRAFGIPQLALQRDLKDAAVVAPYATMLAVPLDPPAAIANLKRLEKLGVAGPMGYYEAIDFTRDANRKGERGVTIYAYMAHHQGMSLLALNNVLHHGVTNRRFHDDLRIRAFESLLYERIPVTPSLLDEAQTTSVFVRSPLSGEPVVRSWEEPTALPRIHLQGNGRYNLMITNSGTGYTRWNGLDITRWRADSSRDPWGTFIYLRDVRTETLWSATPRPLGGTLGSSVVHFSADRAEFHRRVLGIDTNMHVTVAAEGDVELRRIAITNRTLRTRQIEITSYAELVLAPHAADKAHPAFAKMFVETECPEEAVLIAHRRQRAPEEPQVWVGHVLVGATAGIQFETDRGQFLGRGHGPDAPEALRRDLTGSAGAVLDPIFSLRCHLNLEPRERVELCFVTLAASSRDDLMELIARYKRPRMVSRTFEMEWTKRQLEFRHLGIGPAAAHRFQELASQVLYPNPALRASEDRLLRNHLGQSTLWTYGISGDNPIVTVTAADARSLPLIRELLIAHSYLRARGFELDLVILNQETPSYDRPFRQQLERQIAAHSGSTGTDRPGGVFLRDWYAIPEEHRTLILAASTVVLGGNRGTLQQQLQLTRQPAAPPPLVPTAIPGDKISPQLPFLELDYFNGLGGFVQDGREYAIYLKPGDWTPAPWINVMATADFGAAVSENGPGLTWHGNSQSHRLTPWHNDPVSDPQSEAIYVRDEETGEFWSPTPLPIRDNDAFRTRHGQGYTVFEHNTRGIGHELTIFVPARKDGAGDPVKIYRLRLRNDSSRPRSLSVTFFAEWVLGADPEVQQRHIRTNWDLDIATLLARETWTGSGQVAFVTSNPPAVSYSGDRAQFFGREGFPSKPAALLTANLDDRTGATLDPAAVLRCAVRLDAGAASDVVFLLGESTTADDVRALASRYRNAGQVDQALGQTRDFWEGILGTLQVHTPLLSVDLLLNRWLLYQTLSCRFWARTALYQSGGAFGFRDQLQDSLALVYAAPRLTRDHILLSASRQFVEGDVQHWWHPQTGSGVRTHCSDDLLWLPYAVSRYVEITGDFAILNEEVAFLDGPELAPGEQDRLFTPPVSSQTEPLWEHCRRAIDRGWKLGPHNLPLFGTGDWNDGMNHVGIEGRGESCWLGWFLNFVLKDFADVVESLPEGPPLAAEWRERAAALADAMETSAWDGEWYLRGFFDNGAPLGSHTNPEACIDSLPQSWAVISGAADPARARTAMEAADRLLADEQYKIVKLFTPPFDHSEPNPGYIMGYPPGIRENGGQYTHGSLWLAMAWARLGSGEAAVRLLNMMNPIEKTRLPDEAARYRGEPYVAAADVYAAPNFMGRSGWTWYTGSAGWMYRVWLEEVLGFHLRGNELHLKPAIPAEWPGFEITYRYGSSTWQIRVRNHAPANVIEVDGNLLPEGSFIQLKDDGQSHVVEFSIQPSVVEEPAQAKHPVAAG